MSNSFSPIFGLVRLHPLLQVATLKDGKPMDPQNPSESTKPSPRESDIIECPSCYSHRAIILNTAPPRARCADCGKTYSIHCENPVGGLALTDNEEDQEELPNTRQRKTKADYRAEITPAPPLSEEELGPNTLFMQEMIKATPEQIAK